MVLASKFSNEVESILFTLQLRLRIIRLAKIKPSLPG